MWIVDSSVWIDYFGGTVTRQTDLLHAALGWEAIGLVDTVLCDVLQGYRRQRDLYSARQALLRFPVYPVGGTAMALECGELPHSTSSRDDGQEDDRLPDRDLCH